MLLRGFELGFRLRIGDRRLVHLFARDRALVEQLFPAVEQLLRGLERLARRVDVGLRFRDLLGDGGGGRGSIVRLGLPVLAAAGGLLSDQIAVLEHGEQLTLLHMIAAIHIKLLYRCGDLGHDAVLAKRKQCSVTFHNTADCGLSHCRNLHRCRRFFRFFRSLVTSRV